MDPTVTLLEPLLQGLRMLNLSIAYFHPMVITSMRKVGDCSLYLMHLYVAQCLVSDMCPCLTPTHAVTLSVSNTNACGYIQLFYFLSVGVSIESVSVSTSLFNKI